MKWNNLKGNFTYLGTYFNSLILPKKFDENIEIVDDLPVSEYDCWNSQVILEVNENDQLFFEKFFGKNEYSESVETIIEDEGEYEEGENFFEETDFGDSEFGIEDEELDIDNDVRFLDFEGE